MTATAGNGWELSVSTFIAAPPEKVWDIMTNHMEDWFCPKPWRVEIIEQQWHSGGRSAMVMKGPEGEEHPQEGIFLEVVPGVRFVSTDAVVRAADGSLMPSGHFMLGIWEIAPEGDGTRYTARARHWDEANAKQHDDMGFEQGWGAATQQLKELAEG
ncbi:MAG: ATPase [Sphingopyxis sp.]|nr:ATPase [Sphingopyxis sp.]